jgi:acetyl esterase
MPVDPFLEPLLVNYPQVPEVIDDYPAFRAMNQAGVPVTYSMQPGHAHPSGVMTKVMASARAWREEVLTALRRVNEQGQEGC